MTSPCTCQDCGCKAETARLTEENDALRYSDRVHLSAKQGMEARLTARIAELEAALGTQPVSADPSLAFVGEAL